jgi:hypothetical protein
MTADNVESNPVSEAVHPAPSYTTVPQDLVVKCGTDFLNAFQDLFSGRTSAFGYRNEGKSRTSRKPVGSKHYLRHLGELDPNSWSLGIVPIREDNACFFGAIDYDKPDLTDEDAIAIVQRSAFAGLPLVWTLSKSRGLHGWLFLREPQPAEAVRRVLHQWAVAVFEWKPKDPDDKKTDKAGFFEVFPKQDTVAATAVGNYIHLPWTGGAKSPRYGFTARGRIGFAEWLAFATTWRVKPEHFGEWSAKAPRLPSGPSGPEPKGDHEDDGCPTLEEAEELLGQLDTKTRLTPHDSWVRVGMALFDAFGGTAEADAALDLWDEHSRHAENYTEGECERRWRSFHSERERRITFKTLRAWAKEDREAATADLVTQAVKRFNLRWGLTLRGGNAVLETPARGEPQFHEFQRWKRFVSNELIVVPIGRGTKLVPLVEAWLSHPERRSYHGVVFDPALPPYAGVPARRGDDSDQDFNLWPGFAVVPSAEGSCDRFLEHLREIVCRGDAAIYEWVCMWLAHLVQHPSRLAGTALALRGPQGTGKSVVGEVMGTILGDPLYAKVSKPEELTGRFNSHHQGRLLLQVEEGFWAGDKRAEGALKHMITSKVIMVEPKFVDPFPVENFMRLLVTSNKDWVVPAGFGERRFAVLDVSEARKDDRGYHGAMRRELFLDGGCARFLHHLLHEVTVDESVIWRPPVTEALTEQQVESLCDEDTWLMDMLSIGELPGDWEATGRALTMIVFRHYLDHARDLGRSRRSAETKLGIYLKRKSPLGLYGVKVEEVGGRTFYVFPPLSVCREAFAKKFSREIEWLIPAEKWRKSRWGLNEKSEVQASFV